MLGQRLIAGGLSALAIALTTAPASAQAPDHATLAFTLTASDGHGEIYVMRSDGSGRRRLTGGTVPLSRHTPSSFEPAWSPDGGRLAFVRAKDYLSRSGVRTLDLATGRTLTLTSGHYDYGPAWSPDGARIAFARGEGQGGSSIFLVPAGGGVATRLTPASKYHDDSDPAWAPDGSAIAFSRTTFRPKARRIDQDVFVMSADGTDAHRLASAARSPAWSPDRSRIAFLSDRDRNGETCFEECSVNNELYVMDADGGGQQRLTRTKGDERGPAW